MTSNLLIALDKAFKDLLKEEKYGSQSEILEALEKRLY